MTNGMRRLSFSEQESQPWSCRKDRELNRSHSIPQWLHGISARGARAIADAIPVLEKVKEVRIVTVANEKVLDTKHSGEELAKNLSRHGIDVILENVDAAGRSIGEVLETHAASCSADLLVMGAYGHSRLREFILGGATQSMLSKPPVPILFSH